MIPLTVPELGDEEIAAVERVLRSGMLVQGREVQAFEAALAARVGRAHAVAVSNGTAALELALRALDIGENDEVVVPALTWPSPAHAVRAVGARPVLVDVDPLHWNVSEASLRAGLSPKTKAIIAIEQFGNPLEHAALRELAGDIPLVIDAACSLGASYDGAPCGSHGLIACTSFHPRKVITTGEGGACLTDDAKLAARLRVLRNHGQSAPGSFECAAGNERLTEFAAAMGTVQLAKLEAICAARRTRAARVIEAFPALSFQRAPQRGVENRQTLGVLIGAPQQGSGARDHVIEMLHARGVQAGRLSYALSMLPQFEREANEARAAGRSLAVAEDIAARGLCLPLFPRMTQAECAQVIAALREALGGVS